MAEVQNSTQPDQRYTYTESAVQVPQDAKEHCKCFENETRPQEVILDTVNISSQSEMQQGMDSVSPGQKESRHGNMTLNFIRRKLDVLKEYKEAIIDLCHNQLEYHNSIEKLEVAWNCVAALIVDSSPEATKNLLHWVLRQTLHLMLVGEWTTLPSAKRNNIRITIEKSLPDIKCAPNSINRCVYILQYFNNPWSDKRLLAVLYGEARLLTKSDLDYLTAERGCMIVLRLQMLCETKCDEMAFTLSSKALLALRTVNTDHELRKSTSVDHVYFIFDIYLCLVHKYVGVNKFIEEVKRLGLYDALLLIKRNINAETNCSRLIKFRAKVAKLSANITIATIMVDSLSDDSKQYYCAILKEWLKMHQKLPVRKFRDIARKLFSTACSSKHLHLACQIIKDMQIIEWRELLLELYVRVITADLNELELLKSEKTCSAEIVLDNEVALSYRYIQIADLLKEQHPDLTNECILTAFSLNPTSSNYYLVQAAAYQKQLEMCSKVRRNNHSFAESNHKKIFPSPSDHQDSIGANPDCIPNEMWNPLLLKRNTNLKDTAKNSILTSNLKNLPAPIEEVRIIESSTYDVLAAPNLILDSIETIDLPSDIRIDLSVLLSSPRVKFLSWFQTWPELKNHCQKLLKPGGKLEIVRQSLAIANDHLQFLNLDYDQFRNLPENDGPGIEKGYEIFVESDEEVFNHDTYIVGDEVCQRKRRSTKVDRQRKHFCPPFTSTGSSLEQINSKLRELNETSNPIDTRDNLDNGIIQNLLKQQSKLISPFNNYLLQYLSQQSPKSLHSTAELDALFRTLYIQQLQAQLQLSQTYTRALQQQVILPKDSHQKRRLPISRQKNARRRISKFQHKQASSYTESKKTDQTSPMQFDSQVKYIDLKLPSQSSFSCIERDFDPLPSKESDLSPNSIPTDQISDLSSHISQSQNFLPIVYTPQQNNEMKLEEAQLLPIDTPHKKLLESDSTAAPFNLTTDFSKYSNKLSTNSIAKSTYQCSANGADIKESEKVFKHSIEERCEVQEHNLLHSDRLSIYCVSPLKSDSIHQKQETRTSNSTLDTPGTSDAAFIFEKGSSSTYVHDERKDATKYSSINTVQPTVAFVTLPSSIKSVKSELDLASVKNEDNRHCTSQTLVISSTQPNKIVKYFENNSFDTAASEILSTNIKKSPGRKLQQSSANSEKKNFKICHKQIKSGKVTAYFQNPVINLGKDIGNCEHIIEATDPILTCLDQSSSRVSSLSCDDATGISELTNVAKAAFSVSEQELTEPLKSTNGMTFLVNTFESTMTFDSSKKIKGEIANSSFEARKHSIKSYQVCNKNTTFAALNQNNPRMGNFEEYAEQEISATLSSKSYQSCDNPRGNESYSLIPNFSDVQDSDTDTEVDESDKDENASIVKSFEKGNDTDSDTDSSENRALVVQLPRRTYSRVSGSSDRANVPHHQHPEQQSPSFKNNANQRILLVGQSYNFTAEKKRRYLQLRNCQTRKTLRNASNVTIFDANLVPRYYFSDPEDFHFYEREFYENIIALEIGIQKIQHPIQPCLQTCNVF